MIKNIIKLLIYSIIFTLLLNPFLGFTPKAWSGGVIIGFFASLLNEINGKLK